MEGCACLGTPPWKDALVCYISKRRAIMITSASMYGRLRPLLPSMSTLKNLKFPTIGSTMRGNLPDLSKVMAVSNHFRYCDAVRYEPLTSQKGKSVSRP